MTAKLSNPAAAKDPRRTWYGTQIWKTKRAHQLRIEPLCRLCKAQGKVEPATIADHDPPHEGDYNKFILGPAEKSYARPVMTHCKVSSTRVIAPRSASTVIRSTAITRFIKHVVCHILTWGRSML